MNAIIRWRTGGEARIVSMGPRAMVVRSTVPSPPGSRIDGTLESDASPSLGATLRVKVHACKRQPEGDFVLEGRPLDLPRELRVRLESELGPGEEEARDTADDQRRTR
jgi:hypothetical protein